MIWDKIDKLASDAARRLGIKPTPKWNDINHPDSPFKDDTAYSILSLRQKVHEQDLLIGELRIELGAMKGLKFAEEQLRNEHPGLNEAYNQYQVILKLVKV